MAGIQKSMLILGIMICMFYSIEAYASKETAWNWQRFEEAKGAMLSKAQNSVRDIRLVDQDLIPKDRPPVNVSIQGDRVLIKYSRYNGNEMAFVFDTDGQFIFGITYRTRYEGMHIALSPYESGILILDFKFQPGPTVTFIEEKQNHQIKRYQCAEDYDDVLGNPEYWAYTESDARVLDYTECRVSILNGDQQEIVLFDYREEYLDYCRKVDQGEKRVIRTTNFGVVMIACTSAIIGLYRMAQKNKRTK